jgi:hypothetical protein
LGKLIGLKGVFAAFVEKANPGRGEGISGRGEGEFVDDYETKDVTRQVNSLPEGRCGAQHRRVVFQKTVEKNGFRSLSLEKQRTWRAST